MRNRYFLIIFIVIAFMILSSGLLYSDPGLFSSPRKSMVKRQLKARDITDPKVLKVMGEIPREKFVPLSVAAFAYNDNPLPIGEGQTISQPYIVAYMTQVLGLEPGDCVLEIGTGSGYQAAVLSKIVKDVYTVEIRPGLAEKARKRLKKLGYNNVQVKTGDGFFGWSEHAPFNAIMVTAAASYVPPPLIKQLADGGKLVIPLGSTKYYQILTLVTKKGDKLETRHLANVRFVPMTGRVQEKSKP